MSYLTDPLRETYEPGLILLSLAVIFLAGFTALTLADRMKVSAGRIRLGWLLGAAIALGGGIWSMHFVAMLAFELPMPVRYHAGLTVVSILVAILVVAVGLALVAYRPDSKVALPIGGVITGLGVSAMHYTGMAAMQMGAVIQWHPALVALSILIGIAASTAALWLSLNVTGLFAKLFASALMTVAVAGMHYTGMAAAAYFPVHGSLAPAEGMSSDILAVAIAALSFIILFLALLAAMIDQTLANRAQAEALRLRHMNEKLEAMVAERTIELLKAKHTAERASNAKTDFLASMSHELRTPLNAVIGYSELLIEDAEAKGQKDGLGDLEIIRSSGRHILALINDILDLAKIEAGKMEIAVDRARLSELIDDSLAVCRRQITQNDNTLKIELDSSITFIDTDVTKLRQAIINLLSNAGKFTRNGDVLLTTRAYRHNEADWIEIAVRDTGIGIAPEYQSAVFEDFHRGDSNTARHHGGTGLGLALSRRLIRLLGGDIVLDSVAGAGSVFTIRLPARIAETSAAAAS